MNIGMTIKARRQQSIITSFVIKVLGLASNIAKYKYLKKWTSIENLSQNLIKNSHKSVSISWRNVWYKKFKNKEKNILR